MTCLCCKDLLALLAEQFRHWPWQGEMFRECPDAQLHGFPPQSYLCRSFLLVRGTLTSLMLMSKSHCLGILFSISVFLSFWDHIFWMSLHFPRSCNLRPCFYFRLCGWKSVMRTFSILFWDLCVHIFPLWAGGSPEDTFTYFYPCQNLLSSVLLGGSHGLKESSVWHPWLQIFFFLLLMRSPL